MALHRDVLCIKTILCSFVILYFLFLGSPLHAMNDSDEVEKRYVLWQHKEISNKWKFGDYASVTLPKVLDGITFKSDFLKSLPDLNPVEFPIEFADNFGQPTIRDVQYPPTNILKAFDWKIGKYLVLEWPLYLKCSGGTPRIIFRWEDLLQYRYQRDFVDRSFFANFDDEHGQNADIKNEENAIYYSSQCNITGLYFLNYYHISNSNAGLICFLKYDYQRSRAEIRVADKVKESGSVLAAFHGVDLDWCKKMVLFLSPDGKACYIVCCIDRRVCFISFKITDRGIPFDSNFNSLENMYFNFK